MRERLTASFIILSIVLLLGAGAARTYVLRDLFREQVADQLDGPAQLVGEILADRAAHRDALDAEELRTLVDDDERLEYLSGPDARPLVVAGEDWEGPEDPDGDDGISASADAGGAATVTLTASPSVVRGVIGRDVGSIAALFLLI